MTSPAFIFAWQFWRRHRIGFTVIAIWLIGVCLLYSLTGLLSRPEWLGLLVGIPLFMTTLYNFLVFSYGMEIDLTVRETGFPSRLFTLPVSTFSLTFWPIIFPVLVMLLIWGSLGVFVFQANRVPFPLIGLALLCLNFVAWGQALCWFPFGAPFLRLMVYLAFLFLLGTGWTFIREFQIPDCFVVAGLGGLWVGGVLFAYWGVVLSRKGIMPNWQAVSSAFKHLPLRWAVRVKNFKNPLQAQTWMEHRRAGWTLIFSLLIFAFFLPSFSHFEKLEKGGTLAGMFPVIPDVSVETGSVLKLLGFLLMVPVFSAFIAGLELGPVGLVTRDYRPRAFGLTRPLTAGEMILAKFQAAARSSLLYWLLAALILLPWLIWTQRHEALGEFRQAWFAGETDWKMALLLLVSYLSLIFLTWATMSSFVWVGLTGRQWALSFLVIAALLALVIGTVFLNVICAAFPEILPWLMDNLHWLGLGWIGLKLLLGIFLVTCLIRKKCLVPFVVIKNIALWFLIAGILVTLYLWLLPSDRFSWYGIVLVVMILFPFNRLAVTPMALAWHRHR